MSWTHESLDKLSSFAFGLSSTDGALPVGWLQNDHDLKSLNLAGTQVDVGMKGSKRPALAQGAQVDNKSFREAYLACRVPANDGGADVAIGFALSDDGAASWKPQKNVEAKDVPSTPKGQPKTDKAVGMDFCQEKNILAIAFKRNSQHVLSLVYRKMSPLGDWTMSKVTVNSEDYYGAITNPKNDQGEPIVNHYGIDLGDDLVITNEAPALLAHGSSWYLAFSEHGGSKVYLGRSTDITSGTGWTFEALPGVKAAKHMGPGLTWFGGKVVVAWYDDDGKIYTSAYSPTPGTWSPSNPVKVGNEHIKHDDSGPLQLGCVSRSDGSTTLYLSYHHSKQARLVSTTAL